ncbi:uracil permease [Thiospirochaeta perfilievii]|uniref:Uracil permease n=1 Tax=Thiospirochaeta perfilievii TaxID=252967 RepID=A0A5C1QCA0_9SPIO|nr:solute carrier family 23 protein [Thiospirochaeta perfilievii]QEN04286.1 uracil permease [Thiospirochaeta perfilievii]
MSEKIIGTNERPPIGKWIPLSIQHVFAMFGSTVLVPALTGLSPTTALFTSGIGTLIYILITKGRVPAYLGSSFAFIAPIILVSGKFGVAYAFGAAFCVGIFYTLIALIIRQFGKGWVDRLLPPVVVGSIIIVIGLTLAPVAMGMAMNTSGGADGYSLVHLSIAGVTLAIAVISSIVLKGFFNVIPILVGIVGGYLFTFIMGSFIPAYHLIDFTVISNAAPFSVPTFVFPKFAIIPIITFMLVALATIAEHLGDTMVLGKVCKKDFYKDPGIHRTLAGDGIATSIAALFGGPPNTTYGENVGVMAITGVHSVWVTGGAAVVAILLSFIPPVGAFIQTIPAPVMGGVSAMLFGIIASAGIRTISESGVNYGEKRNLTISSVILVVGIGGGTIIAPISESVSFELGGVALAAFIGIILNLILPKSLNDIEEETAEEMIQHEIDK